MQYQGGKCRLADDIASLLVGGGYYEVSRRQSADCGRSGGYAYRGGTTLVSLFCGACAVEAKAAPYFDRVICNDKQPYLIAMLKAAQNGYEFPDAVTEEQYHYVKEHMDEDMALAGFVGFGCSFGGAWWHGLARDVKNGSRKYAVTAKKSLQKIIGAMPHAEFICTDYRDVEIPPYSVVYCDPPYANTSGYDGIKEKFDSAAFWEYMRKLAKDGHQVYISEEHAPDDFICIGQKPLRRTLDRNKANNFMATEKLFVYKEQANNG